MEKKSDVFSEIKKHMAENKPDSEPQTIKNEQELPTKDDVEKNILLKQKKVLRRISMIALFGSLLVIVIVFGVLFFSSNSQKIDESKLAAKVDGKYITQNDITNWQNFLSLQSQTYNQTEILKRLIQYDLLVKEATKDGITVTNADIDSLYNHYNVQTQFNLEKILAAQNESDSDFKIELKKEILIENLFNKYIVVPQINDSEINSFISAHKDYIANQTAGKNLTTKEISDAVRAVLIEINRNNLINQYTQNLMDSDSANIICYNQFAVLINQTEKCDFD